MTKPVSGKVVFLASSLKSRVASYIPSLCRKGRASASATAKKVQVKREDFSSIIMCCVWQQQGSLLGRFM